MAVRISKVSSAISSIFNLKILVMLNLFLHKTLPLVILKQVQDDDEGVYRTRQTLMPSPMSGSGSSHAGAAPLANWLHSPFGSFLT